MGCSFLTDAQKEEIFNKAVDILSAGNGEETMPEWTARKLLEGLSTEKIVEEHFQDYENLLSFDPETGEPWDIGESMQSGPEALAEEIGVFYTFSEYDNFKPFNYKSIHGPSNKEFTQIVYCVSEQSFLKLLAHWNSSSDIWKYVQI